MENDDIRLLLDYIDGRLDASADRSVAARLMAEPAFAALYDELKAIRRALGPAPRVPATLKARLSALLTREPEQCTESPLAPAFDSSRDPLPAGIRGPALADRYLRFDHAHGVVELTIRRGAAGEAGAVSGRVVGIGDASDASGLLVRLIPEGEDPVCDVTDSEGCFVLNPVPDVTVTILVQDPVAPAESLPPLVLER